MFRRHQNAIVAFTILTGTFLLAFFVTPAGPSGKARVPSSVQAPEVAVSQSRPMLGRSYFDILYSSGSQYQIPFPFDRFLTSLEVHTGSKINAADSAGVKAVLIPMGRSLQRNAAPEDQRFRFPRVVVGVDGEPGSQKSLQLNLKNKLYVGYNEFAEILEIISYNEDEGRFEFQVVRDYAQGKKPMVAYANRAVCLSCHQNQTPIFSQGPWSETNASSEISQKLKDAIHSDHYFKVPIVATESISSAIDSATDQANLLPAYQRMWKELCTSRECKAQALSDILIYVASGLKELNPASEWLKKFEVDWQRSWPDGLVIGNPDIPDRNPMVDVTKRQDLDVFATVNNLNRSLLQVQLANSNVPADFEPLKLREPLQIWNNSGLQENNTNRMIRGLAQEFTQSDRKFLKDFFKKNDLPKFIETHANELFSNAAFSRFNIMKSLSSDIPSQKPADPRLELIVEGESAPVDLHGDLNANQLMKNVCAKCHQNENAAPANFMGTASVNTDFEQCRRIEQCAPRILYRLKMRNCQANVIQKKKNPMPPEFFLANHNLSAAEWLNVQNPKILNFVNTLVNENELSQSLVADGLAVAKAQKAAADLILNSCPESDSGLYELLPKCQFNKLKPVTRCQEETK